VCGFTEGKGSRKYFGALLLGAYRDERFALFWAFRKRVQRKGTQRDNGAIKTLFIDKSPVVNLPEIPERIQWVRPKLVREVAFAEWTEDGELRQTTFLGWRDDKNPEEMVLEL
jgi:bifunctional non-homologous end joining protein LigD